MVALYQIVIKSIGYEKLCRHYIWINLFQITAKGMWGANILDTISNSF